MSESIKKVVKFGGSSLASAEQFRKSAAIVLAEESRRYVVPSAPGKRFPEDEKVTDMLLEYLGPTVSVWVQAFLDRITTVLWASSVQIILFISGLCGISDSLYEAATVEGATEWECFWKITVPMISPILKLNIIYTLIDSFAYRDNALVSYILNKAKDTQFSYSATMSWVYFLSVFMVVVVVFFAVRRMDRVGER